MIGEFVITLDRLSIQPNTGLIEWPESLGGGFRSISFECLGEQIVRCRDCRFVHVESGAIKRHWCDRKEHGKPHAFVCCPDGFCSWGQPRENPCRDADADAAAFADAPTLKIASEPPKTPLLELGA